LHIKSFHAVSLKKPQLKDRFLVAVGAAEPLHTLNSARVLPKSIHRTNQDYGLVAERMSQQSSASYTVKPFFDISGTLTDVLAQH
jgi:hypothetical protein